MGEMAEYMLNGDDCQGCGEYLGKGPGFPRWCRSCRPAPQRPRIESILAKVPCPVCARKFTSQKAMVDHLKGRSVDIPQHAPNLRQHREALAKITP